MRSLMPFALAVIVAAACAAVAAFTSTASEPVPSQDVRWMVVSVSGIQPETQDEMTPIDGRMIIDPSTVFLVTESADVEPLGLSTIFLNTPDGLLTVRVSDPIHNICETLRGCAPTRGAIDDEIEFLEMLRDDGVRRGLLDDEAQRRAEQRIRELRERR